LLYKHAEEKHSNGCLFVYFVAGNRQLRGNNRNFRGSKTQHSLPNANVRSEIKDLEQVRKERQKKADRVSYMKSKGSKSKKFGKNGKRGKPRK
jgi:ATP-dependent RNA helicase DDX54/DBP10